MRRPLLALAVITVYLLHQDNLLEFLGISTWRTARPLVFGVVPVGLFYHACFSVAASLLMLLLVKFAWPAHLEAEVEGDGAPEGGER
jgi:hypothetical protein